MSSPQLSVVICTYNRADFLEKCLQHLALQDAPGNLYEILVINNNSTDHTEQVFTDFSQNHPELLLSYFLEENQGLSFSRNRGIEESGGELIAYIDDDAFADPGYVSNLVDYFEQHPEVSAIGGKVVPAYQSQEPDWMSNYLLPLVAALDLGNKPQAFRGRKFPIGANMAFRRAVFHEAGQFHTELGRKGSFLGSGEEKDLFYRLRHQAKQIHYVPDILVSHYIPDKRIQEEYIKNMAKGIGKSEAVRVGQGTVFDVIGKWFEEFFKIAATAILVILYGMSGKWAKARMLVRFRLWVFGSFIKG